MTLYCAKSCVRSGTKSLITLRWLRGYIVAGPAVSDMNRVQANQFVPSMFIEHEPQTPSRQDRRKVSVESISFLIVISASRTMGPQVLRSTSYVSIRGFCPESGS